MRIGDNEPVPPPPLDEAEGLRLEILGLRRSLEMVMRERAKELTSLMELKLKKTDLMEYSEAELNYELLRRQYEKDLAAYTERKSQAKLVLIGIEALLMMEVHHNGDNGCDDRAHYGAAVCTRCKLLDINESQTSEYTLGNTIELHYIGDVPKAPTPPK